MPDLLCLALKVQTSMHLPPVSSIDSSQIYQGGDVSIHPSAAIAPGVLLQADPDSQIIIEAGACIGTGSILHAHQGTLKVEQGANLGAGTLIVGTGKIGTHACIGTATTILNGSIDPGEVIAPGSLIGDTSRPGTPENSPNQVSSTQNQQSQGQYQYPDQKTPAVSDPVASDVAPAQPLSQDARSTPIYGRESLNQLLSTLLPHRQALNSHLQSDQSGAKPNE